MVLLAPIDSHDLLRTFAFWVRFLWAPTDFYVPGLGSISLYRLSQTPTYLHVLRVGSVGPYGSYELLRTFTLWVWLLLVPTDFYILGLCFVGPYRLSRTPTDFHVLD